MLYNYTYMIKDFVTNEFYIGVRSTNILPNKDSYMGSMKAWMKQDNFNRKNHKKTILSIYENRKEACDAENKLINIFINDPLNRNYYIPKKGFSTYGLNGKNAPNYGNTHSKETREKMREKSLGRINNSIIMLDLTTGIYYDTILECWNAKYNNIKYGTFFHRLNKGVYENLLKIKNNN